MVMTLFITENGVTFKGNDFLMYKRVYTINNVNVNCSHTKVLSLQQEKLFEYHICVYIYT